MNRNYRRPNVEPRWADTRETHPAVAMAIHAIASSRRSPEAIWADPTPAEWDHVTMAVEEYLIHEDYTATDDGRYQWGLEAIAIEKPGLLLPQC